MAFYPWIDDDNIDQSKVVPSAENFGSDDQRSKGFEGGKPASSMRVNAALRQANLVACALMKAVGNSTLNFRNSVDEVESALIAQTGGNFGFVKVQQSITGPISSALTTGDYDKRYVGIDTVTGYLCYTHPSANSTASLLKSVSTSSSVGVSNKYARADHQHGISGSTIISAFTVGGNWGVGANEVTNMTTNDGGASLNVARADHMHELWLPTNYHSSRKLDPNETLVSYKAFTDDNYRIPILNPDGSNKSKMSWINAGGGVKTLKQSLSSLMTSYFMTSENPNYNDSTGKEWVIPMYKITGAGATSSTFTPYTIGVQINGKHDISEHIITTVQNVSNKLPYVISGESLALMCPPQELVYSEVEGSSISIGLNKIYVTEPSPLSGARVTWKSAALRDDIVSLYYFGSMTGTFTAVMQRLFNDIFIEITNHTRITITLITNKGIFVCYGKSNDELNFTLFDFDIAATVGKFDGTFGKIRLRGASPTIAVVSKVYVIQLYNNSSSSNGIMLDTSDIVINKAFIDCRRSDAQQLNAINQFWRVYNN